VRVDNGGVNAEDKYLPAALWRIKNGLKREIVKEKIMLFFISGMKYGETTWAPVILQVSKCWEVSWYSCRLSVVDIRYEASAENSEWYFLW
jgi:hypothetical protein